MLHNVTQYTAHCPYVDGLHYALGDVHAARGLEPVVAHGVGLLVQQCAELVLLNAHNKDSGVTKH